MTNQNSFFMYFIIALSTKHFYAIKGSSKAMDSSYFTTFIKELLFIKNNKFEENSEWIICDNASYHVSQLVESFTEDHLVIIITINLYSPSLNPCEVMIASIKAKLGSNII